MFSIHLFSSKSGEWETPDHVFKELNKEFHFTLDPCATKKNAKCKKFYTKKQNGLLKSWNNNVVFVNPPYGKGIYYWVNKACYHTQNATIVLFIPARTDTKWWHECIQGKASEIRFIRGRIKFKGAKNHAPFPSVIVVYRR